jgi:hypothetical protein
MNKTANHAVSGNGTMTFLLRVGRHCRNALSAIDPQALDQAKKK